MPRIAKIDVRDPINKTAIVGFSLNGNGKYNQEEVKALVKQANKFRKCIMLLHGDDEQCAAWKTENAASLGELKKGTEIFNWSELQSRKECQMKYQEFIAFYKANSDFKGMIDETVDLYTSRHPEVISSLASVINFVLEEMAFLIVFAILRRVDVFVYEGQELSALYGAKKYFLMGADQNLLKWAQLSFMEEKAKKKRPEIQQSSSSCGSAAVTTDVSRQELSHLMETKIRLDGLTCSVIMAVSAGQMQPQCLQPLNMLYSNFIERVQSLLSQHTTAQQLQTAPPPLLASFSMFGAQFMIDMPKEQSAAGTSCDHTAVPSTF